MLRTEGKDGIVGEENKYEARAKREHQQIRSDHFLVTSWCVRFFLPSVTSSRAQFLVYAGVDLSCSCSLGPFLYADDNDESIVADICMSHDS